MHATPEVSPHFVTGELFERTQPYGPSQRSVSDPEPGRLELSSRSRSLGSDSRRRAKMRGSLRCDPAAKADVRFRQNDYRSMLRVVITRFSFAVIRTLCRF